MKIFYDIDTQNDFMNKDGTLYVPNAELIKPNLKLLTDYAQWEHRKDIPIIGSLDRHFGTEKYKHREGELQRWGGPFPDHCMVFTEGEEKIPETAIAYKIDGKGAIMPKDYYPPHNLNEKVDKKYIQEGIKEVISSKYGKAGVYFEKQSYNIFTNPSFEYFLKKADVTEAVVYGVAIDYCVKDAVIGMQERGIQTYVVEDAIAGVAEDTTKQALKEMKDAGAKFITTKEVLEDKLRW